MFKLTNKNTTLKWTVFSRLMSFGIVRKLLFIFLLRVLETEHWETFGN